MITNELFVQSYDTVTKFYLLRISDDEFQVNYLILFPNLLILYTIRKPISHINIYNRVHPDNTKDEFKKGAFLIGLNSQ